MRGEVRQIYTRIPNEEEGGYLKFPAVLVSDNVALAIFDEHLEVHHVTATNDSKEFDLVWASNPMFYVGNDAEAVMKDVATLTLVEFARKYTHSDFVEE